MGWVRPRDPYTRGHAERRSGGPWRRHRSEDLAPNQLVILAEQLRADGYQIQTARDGDEALRRLRTAWPDLLIIDMMMPRMDGLTLAREIKGHLERGAKWPRCVRLTPLQPGHRHPQVQRPRPREGLARDQTGVSERVVDEPADAAIDEVADVAALEPFDRRAVPVLPERPCVAHGARGQ